MMKRNRKERALVDAVFRNFCAVLAPMKVLRRVPASKTSLLAFAEEKHAKIQKFSGYCHLRAILSSAAPLIIMGNSRHMLICTTHRMVKCRKSSRGDDYSPATPPPHSVRCRQERTKGIVHDHSNSSHALCIYTRNFRRLVVFYRQTRSIHRNTQHTYLVPSFMYKNRAGETGMLERPPHIERTIAGLR